MKFSENGIQQSKDHSFMLERQDSEPKIVARFV